MYWGLLFGVLFFVSFFGLAIGAGLGALMGKVTKSGIDGAFQEQVRDLLKPGTSALFLMEPSNGPPRLGSGPPTFRPERSTDVSPQAFHRRPAASGHRCIVSR